MLPTNRKPFQPKITNTVSATNSQGSSSSHPVQLTQTSSSDGSVRNSNIQFEVLIASRRHSELADGQRMIIKTLQETNSHLKQLRESIELFLEKKLEHESSILTMRQLTPQCSEEAQRDASSIANESDDEAISMADYFTKFRRNMENEPEQFAHYCTKFRRNMENEPEQFSQLSEPEKDYNSGTNIGTGGSRKNNQFLTRSIQHSTPQKELHQQHAHSKTNALSTTRKFCSSPANSSQSTNLEAYRQLSAKSRAINETLLYSKKCECRQKMPRNDWVSRFDILDSERESHPLSPCRPTHYTKKHKASKGQPSLHFNNETEVLTKSQDYRPFSNASITAKFNNDLVEVQRHDGQTELNKMIISAVNASGQSWNMDSYMTEPIIK